MSDLRPCASLRTRKSWHWRPCDSKRFITVKSPPWPVSGFFHATVFSGSPWSSTRRAVSRKIRRSMSSKSSAGLFLRSATNCALAAVAKSRYTTPSIERKPWRS